MRPFLILGCGYTGSRVAARLVAEGHRVFVTSRHPEQLAIPGAASIRPGALKQLPGGLRVLHSVPLCASPEGLFDPTPELLRQLPEGTARVVYLSTTSVYGRQQEVDETTKPEPCSEQAGLRLQAEQAAALGPWSTMILRPAAIYGPGRGAHVSIPRGKFRLLGDGSNFVSRIHVDDLAALAEAALHSEAGGAWPAADEEPAKSAEIAAFVCALTGCAFPDAAAGEELHETRRSDRRVDGRALCRLLGVALRYPSYRTGIPAALASCPA